MPELILVTEIPVVLVGKSPQAAQFQMPNGAIVIGQQAKKITLVQIAGLNPLTVCSETECRTMVDPCGYCNTVFGNIVGSKAVTVPTYENDFSSFITNIFSLTTTSVNFILQKLNGNVWEDANILIDNSYGTNYPQGSIAGHAYYVGYKLNWGAVLADFGVGIYRIKVNAYSAGQWVYLCSEQYKLLAWNCDQAHGTVKFESYLTGKIGDKRKDYLLHDFSGFTWYDSLRVNGFFGYEKIGEYKTINLEWGNPYHGKIQKVRDEAIQSFEFKMRQDTIQWVHTNLMTYAMMADTLLVSDYNKNNSDYNIKQMSVVRDSGWEPTYYNDKGRRIAGVKVNFKRGVQGVIKTNC